MSAVRILISCLIFALAACLIWLIPIVAPLGRLLVAAAAVIIIIAVN